MARKPAPSPSTPHGGAWKVAYADFVTAMMAFFMMMWLLNATTEDQRQGIADYFSSEIPLSDESAGSDGALNGFSIIANEDQPGGFAAPDAERDPGAPPLAEDEALARVEAALRAESGESEVADALRRHVRTRVTDEGLVIELFDLPGSRLFPPEGDSPTELMTELLAVVADVTGTVPNAIALKSHIRTRPIVVAESGVWPLTSRRADAARRVLIANGFAASRVRRLVGHGDSALVHEDGLDVRNNRIEIVLLRPGSG